MVLAGALLGCAALAMLWVNPPQADEGSSVIPLAGRREITVYDRVVVGSDGSPSALYAVARAHEVASAAEARVVVVEPAEALLRMAGRSPASLIVVGIRGLGAKDGYVLGSVPAEIVRNADRDVLVVQTSALHEDV